MSKPLSLLEKNAGRLEADGRGHAGGARRSELHSVLGDGIAAGHRELVDAAIGLAFDADDLIELGGVEVDRRRAGRRGRRGQWRLALRQRRAQRRCQSSTRSVDRTVGLWAREHDGSQLSSRAARRRSIDQVNEIDCWTDRDPITENGTQTPATHSRGSLYSR